jgi:carboxylesterase
MDRFPIIPGAEPWSATGSGARGAIAMVVSHGLTGNPVSTRPLGEALAAKGFTVEVVRLPGHGTHWRDMFHTRYRDWRGEVARAARAHHEAGRRVVVVGLSLGGTIAVDLACSMPDVVAAAVPINCTILDREGVVAKLAPLLRYVLPVVFAGMAGLVKNDIAKGGDEKAYGMLPAAAGGSVLSELARIRAAIPRAAVPMLVAYSPQDHSVPPENSRALLRMLSGKDATELVLERSYHVATLDYDLDLLVEKITEFGDRVGASRAPRDRAAQAS